MMWTWKSLLLHAALASIWGGVGAAALVGIAPPSRGLPPVATVDIARVIEQARKDSIKIVSRADIAPEQAERAKAELARFGQRMEQLARQLAADHGVLLLQRQALAAGEVPDFTAELQRLMSLTPGEEEP